MTSKAHVTSQDNFVNCSIMLCIVFQILRHSYTNYAQNYADIMYVFPMRPVF